MKIIKILGGLGNQMFQYAFYLSLKQRFPNEQIYVDLSFFNGYRLHNGFELNKIFNLNFKQASFKDLIKVSIPLYNYYLNSFINKRLITRKNYLIEDNNKNIDDYILYKGDAYFDGYWQSLLFFKSVEIKVKNTFKFNSTLSLNNEVILEKLHNSNSISLHIRRGDYLKDKLYSGICELNYYKSAISYILENTSYPSFFIFSNDIEWCKEHLNSFLKGYPINYILGNSGKNSYVDMFLMTNCKHNIIANSSFSWWGAWLNDNPDKIVIAPKKWQNDNLNIHPQLDNWILI